MAEAFLESFQFDSCLAGLPGPIRRAGYCGKQRLVFHGFFKEVDGSRFHCAHAGGNLAMPGEENHRQVRKHLLKFLLESEAV